MGQNVGRVSKIWGKLQVKMIVDDEICDLYLF